MIVRHIIENRKIPCFKGSFQTFWRHGAQELSVDAIAQ